MKNLLLSLSVLSVLTACSSGGSSGSAAGGNGNPTLPNSPNSEWSKVETNLLFKMDRCVNVPNTTVSIRNYITKIDSFTIQMEIDLFDKPNCELAVGANIIDTTRSVRTITIETTNAVDGVYKDLRLVHTNTDEMALTQPQADLLNNDHFCGYSDWTVSVYKNINSCYQSVSDGYVSSFTFKYDPTTKTITLPNGDIFQ